MKSSAPQYSKREQHGWYVYDWANSVFATIVVNLFFGPYLTSLAKTAARPDGFVHLLGVRLAPQAIWPYLVSSSALTQVVALPLLGAIADNSRRKKEILAVMAYIGAGTTMLMYFLADGRYLLGCGLFLIANFAFGGSLVIYNAFLPEIAGPEDRDAVSSNGWGLGYVGGGLLLSANLFLYSNAESFGVQESYMVRISLASTGLWWAVFTVVPLLKLRNRDTGKTFRPGQSYMMAGLRQLAHTVRNLRNYPQTVLFLLAYLVYNDGIQSVLTLAAQFGQEELGLTMSVLTTAILMNQFVGFLGAIAFKYIAAAFGSKRALLFALLIFSGTVIYVYAGVRSEREFYVLAAIVGAVMGGSQALSRSIYSFLIPKGREAEYFSLYEISDKGTSWLGPLFFALALQFTGSYRTAVLSLILFFIVGLLLLARVDVRRAALEAGNEPPKPGWREA